MPRMKVLISGAGIAGNALAFWLSKLGHDVTVIERFPALRSTGLQIDLRGYGISVLKHMGLEKEFRACAAPEQGMQVVSSSGRRWAYFPANKSGKGMQAFTTEYEIMRGDLCRILYDASRQRANYVFGTSIECFKQSGGAVEVRFVDGSTDQYDLVVGADGLWSKTRKMMLGTGTKDAFHPLEGLYVGYFTMPAPVQEGEEYIATQYLATGGRAIMTRRSSPHALQVYVSCKTDSKELRDTKPGDVREKEILTEKFQGAGWRTDEILKSLNTDNDFYLERMGIVKLENWSNGHLTLVGDAAYCPSANTGMGTTSAFVGAYVLAGEIGRYCGRASGKEADQWHGATDDGLAKALWAYEQKFKPFMEQVQSGVLGDNWNMMPSTAFGIGILNCVLGLAALLKIDIISKFVLKENVKGWNLPEYGEMIRD